MEYCGRFTDAAVQIQAGKGVAYTSEDGARCEAKLPDGAIPTKIAFKQVCLSLVLLVLLCMFDDYFSFSVDLDS